MTAPNRIHGRTAAEWNRSCHSKTRYSDENTARAGGFHLFTREYGKWRNGYPPKALWVYRCDNCRGWHLTKKPIDGVDAITPETPQAYRSSQETVRVSYRDAGLSQTGSYEFRRAPRWTCTTDE